MLKSSTALPPPNTSTSRQYRKDRLGSPQTVKLPLLQISAVNAFAFEMSPWKWFIDLNIHPFQLVTSLWKRFWGGVVLKMTNEQNSKK